MSSYIKQIHRVDTYVGETIRLHRVRQGLTQTDLAQPLGISFQQIQKYELGKNRVSASKLFEIADVLEVPVEEFFPTVDQLCAESTQERQDVYLTALVIAQLPTVQREALLSAARVFIQNN